MPDQSIEDLPAPIRKHLPRHGQRIYQNAFNNAWREYADPKRRRGGRGREETAHRVAWSAVEKIFVKGADGTWRRRVD